jgi:type I restriction enzyme S subunit
VSEWQELTLGEIAELVKNTYLPNSDEQLAYIGLEHIEQETLRLTRVGKSSDVTSNKFKFEVNDVLFGKLRPYFRKVYKPKFSGICSTDIWVFRAKKGFVQDFLFYFLASWDFVDTANSGEGGTRMPRADWNFLKTTSWLVPCEEEQKAIASVLSSLDDKIDLLHRQNKTLEAMAETLFRQWFVGDAECPSKRKVILGDLIESVSITHAFPNSQVIFLNTSDVYLGEIIKHSYEAVTALPGQAKKSIRKGDILFSEIRPANGRYAYVDIPADEYVVSTKLMVLRSKQVLSQAFVYFYLTNTSTVDSLQMLAESRSGTFPQITFDQLKDLAVSIPSDELVNTASVLCEGWLQKIKSNHKQICTLEKLRDTLLPRLMSGEVRVT